LKTTVKIYLARYKVNGATLKLKIPNLDNDLF
jgi:hypothetical protein